MRTSLSRLRRSVRAQRGAAMVELALVTLPMIALTLVAIDLGRAVYAYDVLVRATRDATRMVSTTDPGIATLYAPVRDAAIRRAVYGSPDAEAVPLLPGLQASMVAVCDRLGATTGRCAGTWANVGADRINLVSVRIVGYQFQPWFPGTRLLPAGVTTFGTVGTTMRQYP